MFPFRFLQKDTPVIDTPVMDDQQKISPVQCEYSLVELLWVYYR